MTRIFKTVFQFLSSLPLAIFNLVSLTLAVAVGTFVEAEYDTATVQYFFYRATWFHLLLCLLGINLFCVALSRLPWKKKHIPFLLAHLGIILLLIGSWVTFRWGVDGTTLVEEGQSASYVELPDHRLIVETESKVSTYLIPWIPPQANFRPIEFSEYGFVMDRYLSRAEIVETFEALPPSDAPKVPAIHLAIEAPMANASQKVWLWAGHPDRSVASLGLAELWIKKQNSKIAIKRENKATLAVETNASGDLRLIARSRSGKKITKQFSKEAALGKVFETPWMKERFGQGIQIKVLKWIPDAMARVEVKPSRIQYGSQAPPPAVHLRAGENAEAQVWLGVGESAELRSEGKRIRLRFEPHQIRVPFRVRLDRFQIDRYQGTANPSEFSSQVTVFPSSAEPFPTRISMNQPLEFEGYTFYQSSYLPGDPRPTVSIFSVNQDPGRVLKYIGSILLVLGSILLFAVKHLRAFKSVFVLVFALTSSWTYASEGEQKGWQMGALSEVPIQSGGRLKPLGSFAEESVLFLTQKRSYQSWNSSELLLSMISFPGFWEAQPIIKISHSDTRKQLLLDPKRSLYSPRELFQNSVVLQYLRSLQAPEDFTTKRVDKKASPRDTELKNLVGRLNLFSQIVSGQAWTFVPASERWKGVGPGSGQSKEGAVFKKIVTAYYDSREEDFYQASLELKKLVSQKVSPSDLSKIHLEGLYQNWRPFLICFFLYLLSTLVLCISSWLGKPSNSLLTRTGIGLAVFGTLVHCLGMLMRVYISGRPPVSNMYESVIWVSFGVLLFAYFLYWRHGQILVITMGSALAALTLLSADASPAILDPSIQPLVPVLRSNLWLTIHVLTITLSYAAFALTMGIGDYTLFQYIRNRKLPLAQINRLNQLTYRALQFGIVLLASGTILGGVWADYSWGRFWGWDPKETWALIALLCYVVVIHARFMGWLGSFAFPAWTVLCFLSVLMAWYGVNFVLGVGLHSYGFASGGLGGVLAFVVFQLAYVLIAVVMYRQNHQPRKKA